MLYTHRKIVIHDIKSNTYNGLTIYYGHWFSCRI